MYHTQFYACGGFDSAVARWSVAGHQHNVASFQGAENVSGQSLGFGSLANKHGPDMAQSQLALERPQVKHFVAVFQWLY